MDDIYTQYDDEGKRDYLSVEEFDILIKALEGFFGKLPKCGLCEETVTTFEKDDFGRICFWCGICDVFFQPYIKRDTENNRLYFAYYPKERNTEHPPIDDIILVDIIETRQASCFSCSRKRRTPYKCMATIFKKLGTCGGRTRRSWRIGKTPRQKVWVHKGSDNYYTGKQSRRCSHKPIYRKYRRIASKYHEYIEKTSRSKYDKTSKTRGL